MPGTPPAGTPAAGTYTIEDAETHIAALRGDTDRMGEALTQADITAGQVPNTPTAGYTQYSAAGQQKYQSSDTGDYNTGRATAFSTQNPQTVNSATPAQISGCVLPVAAIKYRLTAAIFWTQGSTASGQGFNLSTTGTFSQARIGVTYLDLEGTTGEQIFGGIYNDALGNVLSPAYAAGHTIMTWFEGSVTFTAPGALAINAYCSNAANTWTISRDSFLELMPVT